MDVLKKMASCNRQLEEKQVFKSLMVKLLVVSPGFFYKSLQYNKKTHKKREFSYVSCFKCSSDWCV